MSGDEIDPRAKALMARHAELVAMRTDHDQVFQDIKELVRPDTSDFNGGSTKQADSRRRMFDGTAPWALDQLAAGLHSHLSSPVDIWFMLGLTGIPYADIPFEAKAWLENTTDRIYAQYTNPASSFNTTFHECYVDIGGFGTGVVYQWLDTATNQLRFRAYPLADCWIDENYFGMVDTLHRACRMSMRQVRQEFPDMVFSTRMQKFKDSDKVTIIHMVFPRTDRNPDRRNGLNKPFASVHVCKETTDILFEGGYDWFPYHVPRWSKLPGEVYGRGPALSVIPEIRMVNAMSKALITAAQKMVDPALMVEDDGYLLPIRTSPGSINMRRPGAEPIMPMPTAQRIDVGVEMIEQRREMIRRGFYVDWLVRPTKKERQTTTEIMDDRNQMLSMLGPIVGRQHTELLGPTIALSYNLMSRAGLIEPAPGEIDGAPIEPIYISPAARAQTLTRGQGMLSYLSQVTQLLPVMPNLIHSIDEDALNAELQDITDAPRRILVDPAESKRRRENAEQQQQMQMAAEQAPNVARAAKDLASAKQMGLPIDV